MSWAFTFTNTIVPTEPARNRDKQRRARRGQQDRAVQPLPPPQSQRRTNTGNQKLVTEAPSNTFCTTPTPKNNRHSQTEGEGSKELPTVQYREPRHARSHSWDRAGDMAMGWQRSMTRPGGSAGAGLASQGHTGREPCLHRIAFFAKHNRSIHFPSNFRPGRVWAF